jgi:S-adenosylmethionine synthetase
MKRFPESGEDIKVMAFREKKTLHLTIAMAFVDKFVDSEKDYFRKKQEITEEAKRFVDNNLDKDKIGNSQIYLNTLDQQERGLGGVYLTVTGTSAEDADCGQVGRGNRVNGLIALNRPAGSEAGAGKNPVSHVGKIYSLLSHKIANEVHKSVPDIKEVYVWLCSQIGLPIDQPKVAAAQVIMTDASKFASVEKQIHETIDKELADIGEFTKELAFGKHRIC